MTISTYLPFLIQAVLALIVTGGLIGVTALLGQRAKGSKIKDSPYECGLPSLGPSRTRFPVKFFVTALLFMLLDLEVVILLPSAFAYREFLAHHVSILGPLLFFLGLLALGLFYEYRKGALEWER